MIIVAHPDDEPLGSGVTMNKLVFEEDVIIHIFIFG
jgi:LmbE family N-acetylglucosaminyl deacetylase